MGLLKLSLFKIFSFFFFSFFFFEDPSLGCFPGSLQARGYTGYTDSGYIDQEGVFFNTSSEGENMKAEKPSAFWNCSCAVFERQK